MSKVLRYLRIGFSFTCIIACLLLIVLWVRSYHHYENVTLYCSGVQIDFRTGRGKALYEIRHSTTPSAHFLWYATHPVIEGGLYYSKPLFEILYLHGENPRLVKLGLATSVIPYWLLVPLPVLFASLGWVTNLRWRYSLRTLLITTTLVAVVLGFIAWSVR